MSASATKTTIRLTTPARAPNSEGSIATGGIAVLSSPEAGIIHTNRIGNLSKGQGREVQKLEAANL